MSASDRLRSEITSVAIADSINEFLSSSIRNWRSKRGRASVPAEAIRPANMHLRDTFEMREEGIDVYGGHLSLLEIPSSRISSSERANCFR